MRTIIFNQSNVLPGRQNNTLQYNFPSSVDLTGAQVAVSNVFMYYAWFNISTALNNTTFSYNITNSTGTITRNLTLPDGMYEISDINSYLQFSFIQNNDYLINSATGSFVYFAEFQVNPTRYAVEINTFSIPTVAQAATLGWTQPVGGFGGATLPAVNTNADIVLNGNAFGSIIGFAPSFATTPSVLGTTLTFFSSIAPQVQPNPNLLIGITGIDNKYSNPSSIIYSLSPQVGFGELITERPAAFNFNKFLAGTYNQLTLQFLGTNLQPIPIIDPNMTIILVIRDKDDLIDDIGAGVGGTSSSQSQMMLSRSGATVANRLSLQGGNVGRFGYN